MAGLWPVSATAGHRRRTNNPGVTCDHHPPDAAAPPLRLTPAATEAGPDADPLDDVPPPGELRRRVAELLRRLAHTRRLLRLSEAMHRRAGAEGGDDARR